MGKWKVAAVRASRWKDGPNQLLGTDSLLSNAGVVNPIGLGNSNFHLGPYHRDLGTATVPFCHVARAIS